MAEIGRDHVLYAIDSMGEAGRSVQTRPIPDEQANADWLDEVLAGLGHERYHLVALSRGGWLALNQAIRAPGRVARVTAFDPGGFFKSTAAVRLSLLTGLLAMLMPAFLRRRIKPGSKYAVFVDPLLRSLILAGRKSLHDATEVAARIARLAPQVEVVTVDLFHSLDLVAPPLLRDHVTA